MDRNGLNDIEIYNMGVDEQCDRNDLIIKVLVKIFNIENPEIIKDISADFTKSTHNNFINVETHQKIFFNIIEISGKWNSHTIIDFYPEISEYELELFNCLFYEHEIPGYPYPAYMIKNLDTAISVLEYDKEEALLYVKML